ncbi:MAG: HAD family phosphatase [Oscillospiraceae bacterium]|nr:HAD family phosphatase [Oscillospiraceae bacterium]
MMNRKFDAVVFDMDGLMLDTERLAIAAWDSLGQELYGVENGGQLVYQTLGLKSSESKSIMANFFGPSYNHEETIQAWRKFNANYIAQNGVPVKPGLYQLLQWLRNHNYKTAVASSTSAVSVMRHLNTAGLVQYFDAILCGDMVENGKPAPDIFALACNTLKVPVARCIGLEDSFNGIRSSYAAGLATVMIPDLVQPTPEIEALLYAKLNTLTDVINLLEQA